MNLNSVHIWFCKRDLILTVSQKGGKHTHSTFAHLLTFSPLIQQASSSTYPKLFRCVEVQQAVQQLCLWRHSEQEMLISVRDPILLAAELTLGICLSRDHIVCWKHRYSSSTQDAEAYKLVKLNSDGPNISSEPNKVEASMIDEKHTWGD